MGEDEVITASLAENLKLLPMLARKGSESIASIAKEAGNKSEDSIRVALGNIQQNIDDVELKARISILLENGQVTEEQIKAIHTNMDRLPKNIVTKINADDTAEATAKFQVLSDLLVALPKDLKTTVYTPGVEPSTEDAKNLKHALDLLPPDVRTKVLADGAVTAKELVDNFGTAIDRVNGKNVAINLTSDVNAKIAALEAAGKRVYGGHVTSNADGGIEDHVAQVAPAGSWRVWAEPETGGEAYIPLAANKRGRSEDILAEVADRFGYMLTPFANGGLNLGVSAPGAGVATAKVDTLNPAIGRAATSIGSTMAGIISKIVGGVSGTGGPAGSGQLGAWISQALGFAGVPANWGGPLRTLVMRESGGNPKSINTTDINARNGIPSQGLAQVIPPTFSQYRDERLPNDITDPVANLVAALNYIKGRYGTIFNVQQAVGATPRGYASGGITGGTATSRKRAAAHARALERKRLAAEKRKVAAEKKAAALALKLKPPGPSVLTDPGGSLELGMAPRETGDPVFDFELYRRNLTASVRLTTAWRHNLARVAARAGEDVASALEAMGAQGVELTHRMATGTKTEVDAMAAQLRRLAPEAGVSLAKFNATLGKETARTAQFEKDLTTLAARGYGSLAKNLAESGDEDAQKLAREAVGNNSAARKANRGVSAQNKLLGEDLVDLLAVITAIRRSKGGIHAVADATELGEDRIIEVANRGLDRIKALGRTGGRFRSDLTRANKHLSYAEGGLHTAQVAPAGAWRVWAEPETGGEAYIPLAAAKRARSTKVLGDVAKQFGYGLVPMAAGGVVGTTDAHSTRVVYLNQASADVPLIGSLTIPLTNAATTPRQAAEEMLYQIRRARRGART
jgi:hypothetical protein